MISPLTVFPIFHCSSKQTSSILLFLFTQHCISQKVLLTLHSKYFTICAHITFYLYNSPSGYFFSLPHAYLLLQPEQSQKDKICHSPGNLQGLPATLCKTDVHDLVPAHLSDARFLHFCPCSNHIGPLALPQGLCNCCSLYLECSPLDPMCPVPLHHCSLCSNVTSTASLSNLI